MKPENKAFLEENRKHWITLRDAKYLRHLDGRTREEMRRVMAEEFVPGYTADLWCPPCVSEMITSLYRYFEDWEARQALPLPSESVDIIEAPVIKTGPPIPGKPVIKTEAPIQAKANFPSHKHHRRR